MIKYFLCLIVHIHTGIYNLNCFNFTLQEMNDGKKEPPCLMSGVLLVTLKVVKVTDSVCVVSASMVSVLTAQPLWRSKQSQKEVLYYYISSIFTTGLKCARQNIDSYSHRTHFQSCVVLLPDFQFVGRSIMLCLYCWKVI